jgi:hypothetical protein
VLIELLAEKELWLAVAAFERQRKCMDRFAPVAERSSMKFPRTVIEKFLKK